MGLGDCIIGVGTDMQQRYEQKFRSFMCHIFTGKQHLMTAQQHISHNQKIETVLKVEHTMMCNTNL